MLIFKLREFYRIEHITEPKTNTTSLRDWANLPIAHMTELDVAILALISAIFVFHVQGYKT